MMAGIFAVWLIVAGIAVWVGGFPFDLCLAAAAVGIALTTGAFTRLQSSVYAVFPLTALVQRFAVLPGLLYGPPHEPLDSLVHFAQFLSSPSVLILLSLLSMTGSYLSSLRRFPCELE